jgi:hypothetical protein
MTSRSDSRIGLWNARYEAAGGEPRMYGDSTTAELAGKWLDIPSINVVEDWGCGYGGFQRHLGKHQTYIGIDGSKSRFASITADLADYRSTADAIHMRHVLEHNPAWRDILGNVLASFTKRAVVTLFTPLADTETIVARYPNFCGTGVEMVDISLPEAQLDSMFAASGSQVTRERLQTKTQYGVEYIYFLERNLHQRK